jgi:ferritin-like metal-binding protein YciE
VAIQDLKGLFLHTLKDIYYAERQITKALPKMAKKTDSGDLKKLFESHLGETKTQIERLEKVFEILGEKAQGETCPAIDGIIKEAEELMGEIKDGDTLDAAMIAAAQAVEHYEITRYGTLISWGELLGLEEASNHLRDSLDEEKDADSKLTRIAEDKLNKQAA